MTELRTRKLFARFAAIYGARWTAVYSTEDFINLAVYEWHEVIDRMSDEQVNAGLSWAKNEWEMPPSLSQFMLAGLGLHDHVIREIILSKLPTFDRSRLTYRELDSYVKKHRSHLLRELVEQRLRPAIENTRGLLQ